MFDLSSVLQDAGQANGLEQITYLPAEELRPDPRNFYHVGEKDVEELAANIRTVGLQQPLRVRPYDDGGYTVVSGHRRLAAIRLLQKTKMFDAGVPCIIETDAVSADLQELRLIFANSATRILSDYEISQQAKRVQELLYNLQEQGMRFEGRMRDHVAEAVKASKSKLSRLKVIDDKLSASWRARWEKNELPEETAYALAQLPADFQERLARALKKPTASNIKNIADFYRKGVRWENTQRQKCPDGSLCQHFNSFLVHDSKDNCWSPCRGRKCCLHCDQATRRYSRCAYACSTAKAAYECQKAEDAAKAEKARKAEETKRKKRVAANVERILKAVDRAGLGDADKVADGSYTYTVADLRDMVAGKHDPRPRAPEPFDPKRYDGDDLRRLSKGLHCSLEYLLGMSDELQPVPKSGTPKPEWQTGEPEAEGWYCCWAVWEPESKKWDPDREFLYWRGGWFDTPRAADNHLPAQYAVHKWYPVPGDPEESEAEA